MEETLDITVIENNDTVQLTQKGTVRKRKPKTSINYFNEDTQAAILEYLASNNQKERNKIYNERINYAFYKLVENIIHTFKFYYMDLNDVEDLKHEVITFLLEKLHLYDETKGKAYSYFGTIAKRYLINYNDKNYKKLQSHMPALAADDDENIINDLTLEFEVQDHSLSQFFKLYIKYMDENLFMLFPKETDAKIADAVLMLFKNKENIEIFNKKVIFLYIKEMVDVPTRHITKIVTRFKEIYIELYNEYENNGYLKT